MIEELFQIEKQAYQDSVIHRLDARVKIILCFAAIIAIVAVPYSPMVFTVGAIFFVFVAILWLCTRLSPVIYAKRLLAIVPLWGIIILFQIFFKNKYYTDYHVLYSLPLGISIYAESVEFACILFVKFLVCISFIILLSSTTKMQDLLDGARPARASRRIRTCAGHDDPVPVRLRLHVPEDQRDPGDQMLRCL